MKFRASRQNMVDSQVRPNGVTDRRVIEAMLAVPRERFVPENRQDLAYADEDVAVQAGQHVRCLLAPMTFARMLQLAAVEPDDKVLIVGAGTGYGAAVIARLAAHVVALEQEEDLLRTARANLESLLNVTIAQGELAAGHAVAAPYDVIMLEGRAEEAPQALLAQLADGGRLVAPVGQALHASLRLAVRRDGSLSWQRGADCSACELPGFRVKMPEFVF